MTGAHYAKFERSVFACLRCGVSHMTAVEAEAHWEQVHAPAEVKREEKLEKLAIWRELYDAVEEVLMHQVRIETPLPHGVVAWEHVVRLQEAASKALEVRGKASLT